MTGPEHYRDAELRLDDASVRGAESRGDEVDMSLLAEAQVHATLALAAAVAATGMTGMPGIMPPRDGEAWYRTVSTQPPTGMVDRG